MNSNDIPTLPNWSGIVQRVRSTPLNVANFFLGPVSVHHVVLLRVGMGAVLFTKYLVLAGVMEKIYAPGGLVDLGNPKPDSTAAFVVENWQMLWIGLLVSAFLLTIGFLPRLFGAAAIAGHICFHSATSGTAWGDGTMLHAFLGYALLAPVGARLSVNRAIRLKLGWEKEVPTLMRAWPLRLVQFHVSAMYVRAGWNRLTAKGWLAGRMVFVALSHSNFSRFPAVEWHDYRLLLWLGNWYTVVAETFAPLLLWLRSTRLWWALMLFALHLGLELTSTIGWWQYTMMLAVTTFFPTAWIEQVICRFERLVRLPLAEQEEEALADPKLVHWLGPRETNS